MGRDNQAKDRQLRRKAAKEVRRASYARILIATEGSKTEPLYLGLMLLADACKRVATACETLAVAAIVVDPNSIKAAAFYRHFGFVELPGQPDRRMLPRKHFVGLAE